MSKSNRVHSLLLLVITAIYCSACFESTDGCLENWATNFNALADSECDSCCVAPQLNVTLTIIADSVNYTKSRGIQYQLGDTIDIPELEFVLSEFELNDEDGANVLEYSEEDSLVNSSLSLVNDFLFINSSAKNLAVGSFKHVGTINTLAFSVGLPKQIENPTVEFEDSEYIAMRDSLNVGDDYFSMLNFTYFLKDSVEQRLQLEELLLPDEKVEIQIDTFTQLAINHSIVIEFDLETLWDGVVFDPNEIDSVKAKLGRNFNSSFKLR